MKASLLIVLVLSIAASIESADLDFLDNDKQLPHAAKVGLNITDEVKVDDAKNKYVVIPTDATTEVPRTTEVPQTSTKSPETTSSTTPSPTKPTTSVPLDPTTSVPVTTTPKTPETTTPATGKVTTEAPNKNNESHLVRWTCIVLFLVVIVGVVGMYGYRFYQNRSETSYQNL